MVRSWCDLVHSCYGVDLTVWYGVDVTACMHGTELMRLVMRLVLFRKVTPCGFTVVYSAHCTVVIHLADFMHSKWRDPLLFCNISRIFDTEPPPPPTCITNVRRASLALSTFFLPPVSCGQRWEANFLKVRKSTKFHMKEHNPDWWLEKQGPPCQKTTNIKIHQSHFLRDWCNSLNSPYGVKKKSA